MSIERLVFVVSLIGGILAAISHALTLVDRVRHRRGMSGQTANDIVGAAPPIEVGRRVSLFRRNWLFRWGLGAILLSIAAASGLWSFRSGLVGRVGDERSAVSSGASVAVLPFRAVGGDSEGSVFADGLTENVTSALTAVPGLLVIARHSVMSYKDRQPGLEQVGREQGVRHVVTGTVQWQAQRVRVTVQMSEVATGRQRWSERYDRTPADILAVHDDIAVRIASALQVQLTEGDQARVRGSGTRNLEAWRLATLGFEAFLRYDAPSNAEARRLLEEAVKTDPHYPWAWSALGSARLIAARFGFADSPEATLASAEDALRRAIALDPQLAIAYGSLGSLHLVRHRFAEAEADGRRALELAPGSSELHALMAQTLLFRGKFAEAIAQSQQAVRLSPRHPSWYLIWEAWGQVYAGQPQAGLEAAQRMFEIAESPNQRAVALDSIAFALAESGSVDAAHAAVLEARKNVPDHGVGFHRRTMHFEDPKYFDRFAARLTDAGLSE